MYQYLVDHAIKNVCCNIDQDNQLIFSGQRITPTDGRSNTMSLMKRSLNLPTGQVKYHVFQIGQVPPGVIGLLSDKPNWVVERWVSFKEAINNLTLFVNIYTDNGVELPKFKSWYMFTREKDLIYAVEQDNNIPIDFTSEKIYLRLYTNAYYQTISNNSNSLHCNGKVVGNTSEIIALQNEYNNYTSKDGHVYAYKNGLLVDSIDLVNVSVGDTIEFVYDSSVKRIKVFTINDLLTFTSTLDGIFKYILHDKPIGNSVIDFQDDIDIHILSQNINGRYKGVYFHRNLLSSIRMITHCDYAISVSHVVSIGGYLNNILNTNNDIRGFKVEVKIRHSGYNRPLIYDNNRIFELYKLPSDKILQALTGLNSTVDIWRAEVLENSAYTEIMRTRLNDITLNMVQDAYGYNSMSKITGDSPNITSLMGNSSYSNIPIGLYGNSTVYEYDNNGLLLGWYYHNEGTEYICTNNNAKYIETISGKGNHSPNITLGSNNLNIPSYYNYRVYCSDIRINNSWEDITGKSDYSVVGNKIVLNAEDSNKLLMIRDDGSFLAYSLDIPFVGGLLNFTLTEIQNNVEGTLPVPLGDLDVFLNGKSLIKDLDYVIKFPVIHITNKEYLIQPTTSLQHIDIRFTGFCSNTKELDKVDDFGYVVHGVLSNNSRYDIRDDKVLRITVNGSLKDRSELIFSELHDGISVSNPINGQPYQIKDIIVPLQQLVNENTYSLRDKSIIIDKKISDYMTINLPQPNRNAPSAIPKLYSLFSPFLSSIINGLVVSDITTVSLMKQLSDNDVLRICSIYENLLPFDPINSNLDLRYVLISPHANSSVINLNLYQYRFLQRVVNLYADGNINLSPFITFNA